MRSFYVIKSGKAFWVKKFIFHESMDKAQRFFSPIECENILANLQKKCPICDYEMVVQNSI